ncbi:hypothetical protein BT96DRAFT_999120 [Gymnopus androsaceus JB14]|uniref:Uncharacterized protein n=1 Tax=Gymnopus androsaceus JB14 TaxID=1447944 RepID=A0A6A4H816_9AGAR|nr:hypothetical protein BT96DRAFT_999120 [Gymnopus androsaceus JB14]
MLPDAILSIVKWDTACRADLERLVPILEAWRRSIPRPIPSSPQTGRHPKKQAKIGQLPSIFDSPDIVMSRTKNAMGAPMHSYSQANSVSPSPGRIRIPLLTSSPHTSSTTRNTNRQQSSATAPTQSSLAKTQTPLSPCPMTPAPSTSQKPPDTTPLHPVTLNSTPAPHSPYYQNRIYTTPSNVQIYPPDTSVAATIIV